MLHSPVYILYTTHRLNCEQYMNSTLIIPNYFRGALLHLPIRLFPVARFGTADETVRLHRSRELMQRLWRDIFTPQATQREDKRVRRKIQRRTNGTRNAMVQSFVSGRDAALCVSVTAVMRHWKIASRMRSSPRRFRRTGRSCRVCLLSRRNYTFKRLLLSDMSDILQPRTGSGASGC